MVAVVRLYSFVASFFVAKVFLWYLCETLHLVFVTLFPTLSCL
jgi:hypothetical protein